MPLPPDFRLVTYLSRWERAVRYPLSSSYPESMSVAQLLSLADEADRVAFFGAPLDYPPIRGSNELLDAIATTYDVIDRAHIISFAGGDEAIYATMHALLEAGDHAIVLTPNYQSLEAVPLSLCQVSGVPLEPTRAWLPDLDRIRQAIRPNTKLISINFPNNPTGALLDRASLDELVALCRTHGIWLFSDEVYRLTEYEPAMRLPQVADIYERGISLNVTSKAYGLPGLRIGWVATQDKDLLGRLERMKQYLTICSAQPAEALTVIALKARETILARVRDMATTHLALLDAVLREHADLFEWTPPVAGVLAFPRLKGKEDAESFATRLVQDTGVLLVPSTVYRSDLGAVPENRLRIGFGRAQTPEALEVLAEWLGRERRHR